MTLIGNLTSGFVIGSYVGVAVMVSDVLVSYINNGVTLTEQIGTWTGLNTGGVL